MATSRSPRARDEHGLHVLLTIFWGSYESVPAVQDRQRTAGQAGHIVAAMVGKRLMYRELAADNGPSVRAG